MVEEPENASIQWTTTGGTFDGPVNEVYAIAATSDGTYVMTVLDLTNGYVASDNTTVDEDLEAPEVTLGEAADELSLRPALGAHRRDLGFPESYRPNSPGPAPAATSLARDRRTWSLFAGCYGLEVTFLENGCTTVVDDSVEVEPATNCSSTSARCGCPMS